MHCSLTAAATGYSSPPAGELLFNEAVRLMQDVSRLTQWVQQVASSWESRPRKILNYETLAERFSQSVASTG